MTEGLKYNLPEEEIINNTEDWRTESSIPFPDATKEKEEIISLNNWEAKSNPELSKKHNQFITTIEQENIQEQQAIHKVQEIWRLVSTNQLGLRQQRLQELANNASLRNAYISHFEKNFSLQEPYASSDLVGLQVYGYLKFDEGISVDGKMGNQSKMLIEAMKPSASFEYLHQQINAILDFPKTTARNKIRNQLIRDFIDNNSELTKVVRLHEERAALEEKLEQLDPESEEYQKILEQINSLEIPDISDIYSKYEELGKKKEAKTALSKDELVYLQLFARIIFGDETISVDGIEGTQTREIMNIAMGKTATTKKAREWQKSYQESSKVITTFLEKKQAREEQESRSGNTLQSTTKNLHTISSQEIVRSNPSVKEYVKQQKEIPIDGALRNQWEKEGRLFAIQNSIKNYPMGEEMYSQLYALSEEELQDQELLTDLLEGLGIDERQTKELVQIILHPDQKLITQYVAEQEWAYIEQENSSTIKALSNFFDTLGEYLNYTSKDQENAKESFNLNLAEGFSIQDEKIIVSGTINDRNPFSADIATSFAYDMATGKLYSNSIVEESEGRISIENTRATTELFQLPSFAGFEKQATGQDVEKTTNKEIVSYQKKYLEHHIEKNKTLQQIISDFWINNQNRYEKSNAPEMFHLLKLLDASLRTPEECREMRRNMNKLQNIIKDNEQNFSTESTTQSANEHAEINAELHRNSIQQENTELIRKSPLLYTLFSKEKRNEDARNIQHLANNSQNGIYMFMKLFTKGIDNNIAENISYQEAQNIEIFEISRYLASLEKNEEYTGIHKKKTEDYMRLEEINEEFG